MENNLDIILLDISNSIIEETSVEKPKTYQDLLGILKNKLKKLPNNFNIILQSFEGNEIIIKSDEEYKLIEDILFIREINEKDLGQSDFSLNYNRLSESKQEILDEKYNCSICLKNIKNENPLFCYKCQKIFHDKCLNDWDKKNRILNKNLSCPNCRNELPLEKWEHKLDFKDDRKNEADKMNKLSQYNLIININKAQAKTINELNSEKEKYKKIIEESFNLIKDILVKLDEIIYVKNLNNISNKHDDDLIKKLSVENNVFPCKDISQIIFKKLEIIKSNIKNDFINNNGDLNKIELNNKNDFANIYEFKNEFNLIYNTKIEGKYLILGKNFIKNNKNNIEVITNDKQTPLKYKSLLNKGNNNIKIKIKGKLTNLEYMFYGCTSLKDIGDLKLLDTRGITSVANMFNGCSSLNDITALMNWDVSDCKNFSYMFSECSSLSDIKPLLLWNISNDKNIKGMFKGCTSLKNKMLFKKWKLSHKNFKYLFYDNFASHSFEKK